MLTDDDVILVGYWKEPAMQNSGMAPQFSDGTKKTIATKPPKRKGGKKAC